MGKTPQGQQIDQAHINKNIEMTHDKMFVVPEEYKKRQEEFKKKQAEQKKKKQVKKK
jgi:hypothetical protein